MSKLGLKGRQLWYDLHSTESEEFKPQDLMKFMYGHILEAFVIFLAKEAGYEVTDEQKEVSIDGIPGHIDCRINGVLVDVKSASDYAFKKFKSGDIFVDDPFGYITQISSYGYSEGDKQAYFLVINKVTGELWLTGVVLGSMNPAPHTAKKSKEIAKLDTPPEEKCYPEIPIGKSGNKGLTINCSFCLHKHVCWKDANEGKGLRAFKYSYGTQYLTDVKKEPKVDEIT